MFARLGTRPATLIVSERWSFYIFSVHGGGCGEDGGEEERAGGATGLDKAFAAVIASLYCGIHTTHGRCVSSCLLGDNERRPRPPVRPSVEVGVPYQAGTEAATVVGKGDGPQPPPWPLGPLDNMWMAHLLPSAKTSVGESNTFLRDLEKEQRMMEILDCGAR